MKNLADDPKDDINVVIVPEEKSAIVDPEQEAVRIEACEYCGHYPCGCGG